MATVPNNDGVFSVTDKPMPSPLTQSGPYSRSLTVVPSDTVDLPNVASSLYCGGAGTVTIIKPDGTSQIFTVIAGTTIWERAKRVMATGTTVGAGLIVSQY